MDQNPTAAAEAAPEAEHDEHTGEIRPFVDTLRHLDRGAILAELDRLQHEVVAAVMDTGRGGTVKIALSYTVAGRGQIVIRAKVDGTTPKEPPAQSIFYVDDVGNLVRDDPRQRTIFDGR